jgi:FtsH-binding integral membrane protein
MNQMHGNLHSVSSADIEARVSFIRRTYAHLTGAIFAFIFLEGLLFMSGADEMIAGVLTMGGGMGWMVVLMAFMGVGHFANKFAMSNVSRGMQYFGLGLYVVAEAIIFVPLLYMAVHYSDNTVIPMAGAVTLIVFAALTVFVFMTKKDFSFLGPFLFVASIVAIGAIFLGLAFGWSLGLLFSAAMVLLASGYILYSTSNVLLHYRTDQHVAAALSLFASVALLFFYILRIFMSRD